MPVDVLATRGSVHVDNLNRSVTSPAKRHTHSIDPFLGTDVNNAVEMLEARLLEDARVEVILKVAVVDRDANAIESKRLVEFSVSFGEEIFQELGAATSANQISNPLSMCAHLVEEEL